MKHLFWVVLFVASQAQAQDAVRGRDVVFDRESNCLLCHAVPGAPRPAGNLGPSLAGVGKRMGAAELKARIVDSSKFNRDTIMPAYGRTSGLHNVAAAYKGKPVLTPQQIDDAAAFLLTLK